MALKTKEKLNENIKKVAKTEVSKTKSAVKKEPKVTTKKVVKKAPSTKKVATKKEKVKVKDAKKITDKKLVNDEETSKKETVKKTSSKNKNESTKKTSAKKSVSKSTKVSKNDKILEDSSSKKSVVKKEPKETKTKTVKKSSSVKKVDSNKKDDISAKIKPEKKVSKRKTTSKSSTKSTVKTTRRKSQAKIVPMNTLEYYDLPYRYNQTIVKVLAQNPNTLFVYWDISDKDRLDFEEKYGKDFFYKTRPVLVIHNITNNYTFEIDINDFANNWYVNVEDTKCKYLVELGRRPNYYESQAIPVNYLNIAFSNTIEIPNDRILFFKENDRIYFKNIKTNKITEKVFKKETYAKNVKGIYKNYDLSLNDNKFDFNNPSSQNPTSTLL